MELDFKSSLRADLLQWKLEKENIRPIETQTPKKEAKVISFRKYLTPLAIAASIALALSFWFVSNQYSNSALSGTYFENSSSRVSRGVKGTSTPIPQVLIPGWNAIQAKQYESAIQLLVEIKDENYVDQAQLLVGEAQYELKEFEAAAQTFGNVLQSSNFANFKDQAEWQLGLTYLAQSSTESKGVTLIQKIAKDPDHSHYPDAKKLMEDKGSFWGRWF